MRDTMVSAAVDVAELGYLGGFEDRVTLGVNFPVTTTQSGFDEMRMPQALVMTGGIGPLAQTQVQWYPNGTPYTVDYFGGQVLTLDPAEDLRDLPSSHSWSMGAGYAIDRDKNGNRVLDSAPFMQSFNTKDGLTQRGAGAWVRSAGNSVVDLNEGSKRTHFLVDAFNRVVGAEIYQGAVLNASWSYLFDGFGRRISKRQGLGGSGRTDFLHCGMTLMEGQASWGVLGSSGDRYGWINGDLAYTNPGGSDIYRHHRGLDGTKLITTSEQNGFAITGAGMSQNSREYFGMPGKDWMLGATGNPATEAEFASQNALAGDVYSGFYFDAETGCQVGLGPNTGITKHGSSGGMVAVEEPVPDYAGTTSLPWESGKAVVFGVCADMDSTPRGDRVQFTPPEGFYGSPVRENGSLLDVPLVGGGERSSGQVDAGIDSYSTDEMRAGRFMGAIFGRTIVEILSEYAGIAPATRLWNGNGGGWDVAQVATSPLGSAGLVKALRATWSLGRALINGMRSVQGADSVGAPAIVRAALSETEIMQAHVRQAAMEVDALGDAALTPSQVAAIQRAPVNRQGSMRAMYRGERIDKRAKDYILDDAVALGHLRVNTNVGADIVDPATGWWWDITTPGQWGRHVKKYGENGTLLSTRP